MKQRNICTSNYAVWCFPKMESNILQWNIQMESGVLGCGGVGWACVEQPSIIGLVRREFLIK